MAETQPMHVRLSDEERDALRRAAATEGRTTAAMARRLIVRGLHEMRLLEEPPHPPRHAARSRANNPRDRRSTSA
jgi:hypothetical protein